MKKKAFLALLAFVLAMPVGAQTHQEVHDSLSALIAAIGRNPESTDLRLRKAALNIELGQWEYAVEEYGRVLAIDEHNLAAHYYRAYAYSRLRRLDMARSDYSAVLAIVPNHFEARLGLAHVLQQMDRRTDALDALNILVAQHPDSATAYAARAAYETTLQQYETALYDWDEAIRRRPLSADLAVSKVDLLLRLGRTDEARAELASAISRGIPRYALKEWTDRCK